MFVLASDGIQLCEDPRMSGANAQGDRADILPPEPRQVLLDQPDTRAQTGGEVEPGRVRRVGRVFLSVNGVQERKHAKFVPVEDCVEVSRIAAAAVLPMTGFAHHRGVRISNDRLVVVQHLPQEELIGISRRSPRCGVRCGSPRRITGRPSGDAAHG